MTKEELIKAYESKLEKLKREYDFCKKAEFWVSLNDTRNEIYLVKQFLENLNELK